MKHKMEVILDGPVDMVWEARERRFENPDKFPDLKNRHELSRREENGKLFVKSRVELANKVPSSLRKVIKPEMLNVIDDSVYELSTGIHTWTYTPEAKSDFFKSKGYSKYTEFEQGGEKKTRRALEIEVNIRIPIVGGLAEQFIIDLIKKNLLKDNESMQQMLRMMKEEKK